jgi:hypothetical protein
MKGSTPRMESNMASLRRAVLSLQFTRREYAFRRAALTSGHSDLNVSQTMKDVKTPTVYMTEK